MADPRFLILRLGSLGDIVHTCPAVAGLRESFPRAEIIWLVDDRWRLLVDRSSLATDIWNADTRAWSSVRRALDRIRCSDWEAAIDFQGLWKTALFGFLGGVKRRIGFASSTIREFGVPLLYSERVRARTTHIADQNGELALRAGARRGTAPFSLRVAEDEQARWAEELHRNRLDRYVAICPGGGWRSKCWPADRYGEVCRRLRDVLGLRCVVNFGPGEEDLAQAVRQSSGDSDPLLDCSSLGPLMAMLKRADLVIGGDTGPLHLAIALGARAVALHGPTDPARNGPYRSNDVVLRGPNAKRDHRRGSHPDPSLLEISVDAVVDAAKRRLEMQP